MSDVFSFGVVLLELMTGKRILDKSRPGREQDLVEWAKPSLKDTHKLDRVMDPRLEGQYSTEGARKAAALAHQCLSHNPKARPTMSNVVKTLELLLDLNDIPVGPFVYVVPTEGKEDRGSDEVVQKNMNDGVAREDECELVRNGKEEEGKKVVLVVKKEKGSIHRRNRKGHRHRHRTKSMRSNAVHSDTALYKTLGTGLYSPK